MYGHPVDPMVWARLGPRFGAMGSGAAMGFFLCSPLYWVGSGGETHADKGRSGCRRAGIHRNSPYCGYVHQCGGGRRQAGMGAAEGVPGLGGYLREGFVCSGEPGEAAGPAAA